MRPVTGTTGKSEKQPGDTNKKDLKREAEKSRKTRDDIDSSEENQSTESLEEGGKKAPKMNSKQLPKNKDKEVRVAPNSTTYSPSSSTDPRVRPSNKRDAFQGKVKREQKIGNQHPHRRRETNLKENHPELKSLQSSQRKKELVDRSKAAGGYLGIEVKDKKDVDMLVDVLNENSSIHSLKLVCNFGGESGGRNSVSWNFIHENLNVLEKQDFLGHESLEQILNACEHLDTLDIKGCRLSEKSWEVLANKLLDHSSLLRLELGGGDKISQSASEKIHSVLVSDSSSLMEFIVDDLSMDYFSAATLVDGISKHGKLSVVKLENINDNSWFTSMLDIDSIFILCARNPNLQYLSVAGTKLSNFEPANDANNFSILPVRGPSANSLAFTAHTSLRVLDLTNCGLNQADMSEITKAAEGHAALIDIRTEGNSANVGDRSVLTFIERRNRALLQNQASAALDLLADHAAHQIETWPRELSDVLAQNASPIVLDALASLIGKDAMPQPDKSGSDNLKPSEPGS
jgi:hypothetical protein